MTQEKQKVAYQDPSSGSVRTIQQWRDIDWDHYRHTSLGATMTHQEFIAALIPVVPKDDGTWLAVKVSKT